MKKILLIDDDRTTLLVAKAMIMKNVKNKDAISVSIATKIADIEDELSCYDIIICDDDLGNGIRGFDFLKRIEYGGLKILLTGNDSIAMQVKMLANTNIKYVLKNINEGENATFMLLSQYINEVTNEQ